MTQIAGRVVIVTGGARGIGRAIATEAARRGAVVAIGDIDETMAKATANAIGGRTIGAHLDVTDKTSFRTLIDRVEKELGPLDILVNNAGIMPVGAFENEADEVTRRQVDINVMGPLLGSKLALSRMLPRSRGHIINVASGAGYISAPGVATYCATKHAVVGLTESLRLEFTKRGIAVTAVLPGAIDTELTDGVPDVGRMGKAAPAVVGSAVVDAMERPRALVFVPRYVGVMARAVKCLPPRAIDRLFALVGASRGYLDADQQARADYEARTRRS